MPAINVRFQILRKYNSYTSFNFALLNLTIDMETTYTIKNFRRFDSSGAKIKFAPITFMTGTNSSGKSSIVKSLILFERYLKSVISASRTNNKFLPSSFTLDFYDKSLKLGGYDIIFNRNSCKDDCISFEYSVNSKLLGEEICVEYRFEHDNSDKLNRGKIRNVAVMASNRQILFSIRFDNEIRQENVLLQKFKDAFINFAVYSIKQNCIENIDRLNRIPLCINGTRQESISKKNKYYSDILCLLNKLPISLNPEKVKMYDSWIKENDVVPFIIKDIDYIDSLFDSNKDNIMEGIIISDVHLDYVWSNYISQKFLCNHENYCTEDLLDYLTYNFNSDPFFRFLDFVFKELLHPSFVGNIEYIGTSIVAQKRLYSLEDSSDDLGELLGNFLKNKSPETLDTFPGYEDPYIPKTFMQKWIRKFGIGDRVVIERTREGQGINIRLYNNQDDKDGHLLADEGYGITQLLALLINIEVAIMKRSLGYNEHYMPITITIEEPEVHLHPALQSMLADMLLDAYKNYKIHFIIETHSEYLIRATQVYVAQQNYDNETLKEKCPFIVYYVPVNGLPYDLEYTTSGRFVKKFGEGFFDMTSSLNFELYRIENNKQ